MKQYAYESDVKARYSTDYIYQFSKEWNEAIKILEKSKVDLSKIILVEKDKGGK